MGALVDDQAFLAVVGGFPCEGCTAFRKKSEAKMREIIQGGATTILVSHSVQQVRELCNKVLWLEKGEQVAFGETGILCDLYQRFLDDGEGQSAFHPGGQLLEGAVLEVYKFRKFDDLLVGLVHELPGVAQHEKQLPRPGVLGG